MVSLPVHDADAALAHLAGLLAGDDGVPGPGRRDPTFDGVVRHDRIVLDLVPAGGPPGSGYLSPVFRGRLSADGQRLEGRFAWGLGLKLLVAAWLGWVVLVVPRVVASVAAAGGDALAIAEAVVPPLIGLLAGLGLVWLARRHADLARGRILEALEGAASARRDR